jgi:hypothetical protein
MGSHGIIGGCLKHSLPRLPKKIIPSCIRKARPTPVVRGIARSIVNQPLIDRSTEAEFVAKVIQCGVNKISASMH